MIKPGEYPWLIQKGTWIKQGAGPAGAISRQKKSLEDNLQRDRGAA